MNRIFDGDCLEVLRGLPSNSVDALITAKSLVIYGIQSFLGYNKRVGQCYQHPRHGNLVSVGYMTTLKNFVDRDCPACGKTYQANLTRLKHGRQTTCSRKCSYLLRAEKLSAEKTAHECPVCLSEFERLPSQKKDSQAVYCSQKCAYKGRTLGITKRRVTKPYKIVNSQEKPVFVDCVNCGKQIRTIPYLKNRKKFCSKRCQFQHWQTSMRGDANPSWVDGRSYQKRCHRGHDWELQRKAAYERDGYTCQSCGVKCIGRRDMTNANAHRLIQCHHIIFWKEEPNNSLENLVTLCASCHATVHFGNKDINEPT